MDNKTPILPDDLQNALERYYTAPEPSPEFSARLDHELRSKLLRQETQKMFGRKSRLSPRLAWGLGLTIVALLAGLLIASPTVVAAMKRLLGYIPGVGVVEQSAPLRVLAEPVLQTRDGIVLTVKEAVLSVDKTIIVFDVDNIPWEKLSHEEGNPGCLGMAELRLPDGATLEVNSGSANGWGSGYESRFTFPPLPAGINEATLLVPCIQGGLAGMLPENWELSVRFVPAPAEMTVFPVSEATPLPAAQSTEPTEPDALVISNVIDTGDTFILSGSFSPAPPETAGDWSVIPSGPGLLLTDVTGQSIPYDYPQDIDLSMPADMHSEAWALEVKKNFVAPLTISYQATYMISDPQATYAIDFDTGANPQVGQTWEVNKEIQMAGHVFTLGMISMQQGHAGESGYVFEFFSVDGSVLGVNVGIAGFAPQGGGGGGGGGGGSGQVSNFSTGLYYPDLPKGRLTIVLSNLQVRGETRTWSLDWAPDSPLAGFTPPAASSGACLTLAAVQEALAAPQPLPATLTGKLIVYGRIVDDGQSPSPDNYAVFVASLDGSARQVLGPGAWPALSPDGTKAAYASEGGLYMTDLASGQRVYIPGTKDNDYNPRWSSDGSRIAFVRAEDTSLYIVNADGSALHKVTGANYGQLIGWSADGNSLYFGVLAQSGYLLKKVDLSTGAIQDFFSIASKGLSAAISPDENWVATIGKMADDPQPGLFLSRLDGSEHRLLAQFDQNHWGASNPLWSADGQWLLLTVTIFDRTPTEEIPLVVNVDTCQVFPLPLRGSVQSWE